MAYNENEPTIIEHTTVNPVIERNTVVDRDPWYGAPWAVLLMVAVIAVVGLLGYWAVNSSTANTSTTPVVERSTTTIDHEGSGRAQTMSPAPVIVNTPASTPSVNVTTPAPNVTVNNPPSNTDSKSTYSSSSDKSDSDKDSSSSSSTPSDSASSSSSSSSTSKDDGN